MNFIWDIVLKAAENGYRRQDLYFTQAKQGNPYCEQAFPCLNETGICSPVIEINSLFRFSGIFKEMLHPDFKENLECFAFLFDILVHYLAETDLRHGLSNREYLIRKIMQEIKSGFLGERVRDDYGALDTEMQYDMANLYLSQMQTGSSLVLFRKVLIRTFPDAFVYQSNRDMQQILVYVSDQKTEALGNKMDFVLNTFLPVRFRIRVFWEHHFEIIGVDSTMLLDETVIF